jgi:hypothetical protein
MKVSELIGVLNRFPADMDVVTAYPSGDHIHTTLAADISDVDVLDTIRNAYHQGWKIPGNDSHLQSECYCGADDLAADECTCDVTAPGDIRRVLVLS